MKIRANTNRGFTLIELLTVVAIIAMLVALLFPAINAAIKKAENTRVKAAVTGLATAFRGYYNEFNRWPSSTANDTTSADLATNVFANPRNMQLFDFPPKDVIGGFYCDPWKNRYQFRVDANFDGQVTAPDGTTLPYGVIVYSKGSDGQDNTADDVKSW